MIIVFGIVTAVIGVGLAMLLVWQDGFNAGWRERSAQFLEKHSVIHLIEEEKRRQEDGE